MLTPHIGEEEAQHRHHHPNQPTNQRTKTHTGLGYSVEHFRGLGIDTPDKFAGFSLPDYDLVGVTDTEDRKRLFFLVQRVKVVSALAGFCAEMIWTRPPPGCVRPYSLRWGLDWMECTVALLVSSRSIHGQTLID